MLFDGHVVASSTSVLISEERYQAHLPWEETVGGHFLEGHDPAGTTLYGVDISVHPDHRGKGLARQVYEARFAYVRENRLARFATACRLPGLAGWLHGRRASKNLLEQYLGLVNSGELSDRTLTPLLKLSTTLVGGAMDYMDDEESCNCAALLEWSP